MERRERERKGERKAEQRGEGENGRREGGGRELVGKERERGGRKERWNIKRRYKYRTPIYLCTNNPSTLHAIIDQLVLLSETLTCMSSRHVYSYARLSLFTHQRYKLLLLGSPRVCHCVGSSSESWRSGVETGTSRAGRIPWQIGGCGLRRFRVNGEPRGRSDRGLLQSHDP